MKKNEVAASFPAAAGTSFMPLFFDPLEGLTEHRPTWRPQSAPADPRKSTSQRSRLGNRSRRRTPDRDAMLDMVIQDLHALGVRLKSGHKS